MIDYSIIQHSIEYYEQLGFKRIESPWTVSQAISDITKPKECGDFTIKEKNKVLVASGEQSFLSLINKGFLPPGMYQTVTPCFRDETFTPYHTKYFIKNELIITDDTSLTRLAFIVASARNFFRQYCLGKKDNESHVSDDPDNISIIETTNGGNTIVNDVNVTNRYKFPSYDLVYRGIELGSYGIRRCEFLTWIYGTGVAEPRLSRVLQTYGVSYQKNQKR